MSAAEDLGQHVGVVAACQALDVSRASVFRRRRPSTATQPRPRSHRALLVAEREKVLVLLNNKRFEDKAPAEVFATLLDEGMYLASTRTMYRILAANAQVRERRDRLRHPSYEKPEILATGPNQLWSWDVTKLKGPETWRDFHLNVVLDALSRHVVGWMLAEGESATLAERPIAEGESATLAERPIAEGESATLAERPIAEGESATLAERPIAEGESATLAERPIAEGESATLAERPIAEGESATLAERPIAEAIGKQMPKPLAPTLHADHGAAMRSKKVAQLSADLGVTKSHSRPHTSNDNPFSESQFKMLKHRPSFHKRFGCLEDARASCRNFFAWYNGEHRHQGIALLTPSLVHHGHATTVLEARQHAPHEAYARPPERFPRRPRARRLPEAVWINPPDSAASAAEGELDPTRRADWQREGHVPATPTNGQGEEPETRQ